jgi:hypothetical protein
MTIGGPPGCGAFLGVGGSVVAEPPARRRLGRAVLRHRGAAEAAAPHLHTAVRGSIAHEVIRQVTAATYHQVWWPNHDELIHTDRLPVWDMRAETFVDPEPANC